MDEETGGKGLVVLVVRTTGVPLSSSRAGSRKPVIRSRFFRTGNPVWALFPFDSQRGAARPFLPGRNGLRFCRGSGPKAAICP